MAQSHFSTTFIIFFKNLNLTKMTGEELLKLYEQKWSERPVFNKGKDLSLESKVKEAKPEERQEEEEVEKNLPMRERAMSDETMMRSFKMSLSDSSSSSDDMFLSPRSVLSVKASTTKLQTILSGKEVDEFVSEDARKGERVPDETEKRRKLRTRRGKSMSDLEYEELKGFMDLGFVFSLEDQKDTDLVSILPGLQRLVKKDDGVEVTEEDKSDGNRVARPYLSEAWRNHWGRKGKRQVTPEMRWRIPVPERENDLKEQLKLWAHAVATTIR